MSSLCKITNDKTRSISAENFTGQKGAGGAATEGTEDYFCDSWNFDVDGRYTEFCTPYASLSKVSSVDGVYKANQRFSMYRWHIADPIHFSEDIKVTIQALGWRSEKRYLPLQDDISSVSFWYQDSICKNFPEFPSADALEII